MKLECSGISVWFFAAGELALLLIAVLLGRRLRRLTRIRDALLKEKDVVFSFVHDVGEVFSATDSVNQPELLRRVLYYALRTTRAGAGALYLADEDGTCLHAAALSGVFPPMVKDGCEGLDAAFSKIRFVEDRVRRQAIRMNEGVIGEVAAGGMPALIPDAVFDPRVPRFDTDFLRIRSLLAVPMRFHSRVLGVLVVVNRVDDRPFIPADQNLLQALADQASVSIHYAKFSAALEEKRRLDYDLNVAHKIQTALLPRELPRVPGIELAAFSLPAQQIGGDFYDVLRVDADHVGLAIADVSGKGVTGAILMAICRTVLRMTAAGRLSAAETLRQLNQIIRGDLSEDMYVTILYMVYNIRTRELNLARAGHTSPLIIPADGRDPYEVEMGGMGIGLGEAGRFEAVLEARQLTLQPGDRVVAYTDGVTEAMDANRNEWGRLNLVKTLQLAVIQGAPAEAMAVQVRQKLLQFTGDTPQYDDLTLVALQIQ